MYMSSIGFGFVSLECFFEFYYSLLSLILVQSAPHRTPVMVLSGCKQKHIISIICIMVMIVIIVIITGGWISVT